MRARMGLKRTTATVLVISTVWLAGCATGTMARDESQGVSDPDRKRAANECVRASLRVSDSGELFMPYLVDRDVYARCMEARGYATITR